MTIIAEKGRIASFDTSKYAEYTSSKSANSDMFQITQKSWAYLGKVFLSTRHYINAALKSPVLSSLDFASKAKVIRCVNQLKLFNIVTFVYSIEGVKQAANNFFRSLEIEDVKGIALSGLTFALLSVDIVDTLMTVYSGVLALGEFGASQIAMSLDLPIAATLSILGMLVKGIQVYQEMKLKNRINELAANPANNYENLRDYLAKKLGDSEVMTLSNEKKMKSLKRFLSAEIIDEMKKVVEGGHVERNLNNLVQRINNKIVFDTLNGIASLVVLGAVISFSVTAPAALPFLFLGTSMVIRLAALKNFEDSNKSIAA